MFQPSYLYSMQTWMTSFCNVQSLTHNNHTGWNSPATCAHEADRGSNSSWIISVSGDRTVWSSIPPLLSQPAAKQSIKQPKLSQTIPPGDSDLLCRLVKMFFCPSHSLLFSPSTFSCLLLSSARYLWLIQKDTPFIKCPWHKCECLM